MKKLSFVFILPLLLCGCNNNNSPKKYDYGAFLGESGDASRFSDYASVSIEVDEFKQADIKNLIKGGTKVFAYLNVGSLEEYRSYYSSFEKYTFMDYENWEDERWIDVTRVEWQDYVINTLAKHFKDLKCYGVYMDNVDVYSICKEEDDAPDFMKVASSLKTIIDGVSKLGLKVMTNGGAELIDDACDNLINPNIIENISIYHQEEVFSYIEDYKFNVFGYQNEGDKTYYQYVAKKAKGLGKEIYFLEYGISDKLAEEVDAYCKDKGYHYYISSTVDLTFPK